MSQQETTFTFAVESFLIDCQARRLTKKTLEYYSKNLRTFTRYLTEKRIEHVEYLTQHDLRHFMLALRKRDYSAQYQHNIYRSIRTFLNFCVTDGILEESPLTKLRAPKLPTHEITAFTADEIKTIFKACETERDRAICMVLLDSGLRLSELLKLNVADVNLATGAVKVKEGKGQKERTVYLGAKSRRQLHRYISERKSVPGPNSALFVGQRRPIHRLTVSGITQLMGRLADATGIEHCSCHTFRRTFALNCLRNGMNVYALAKLMGHADIQMLTRYLRIQQHDLAEAHSEFGVVDNL